MHLGVRSGLVATKLARGGGGGVLPYRYVPPQKVGFLRRFGLKTGIDFCLFWSGIGNYGGG